MDGQQRMDLFPSQGGPVLTPMSPTLLPKPQLPAPGC